MVERFPRRTRSPYHDSIIVKEEKENGVAVGVLSATINPLRRHLRWKSPKRPFRHPATMQAPTDSSLFSMLESHELTQGDGEAAVVTAGDGSLSAPEW